jgi:aromatic ring-opening dioxygenase LigB subunit
MRPVSGLVFAAVAPHGGIAVEEWCAPEERDLARTTRAAMEELGRRFEAATPEAAIVLTPHGVHVDDAFAVVRSADVAGSLDEAESTVELTCPGDPELAAAVLESLRGAGLPSVGVTYGGNGAKASTMPLDWGALIPLWFMGGRRDPPVAAVVVSPSRDRSLQEQVEAGRAIAAAADASGRRIALIASADHGHAHDPEGPYGFDPAAAKYDELVVEAVRAGELERLLDLELPFVEAAKADSLWQLLVLHGALGDAWRVELLSYEAPTYFGMLCAAYTQK